MTDETVHFCGFVYKLGTQDSVAALAWDDDNNSWNMPISGILKGNFFFNISKCKSILCRETEQYVDNSAFVM